jgi:hypothetical protein
VLRRGTRWSPTRCPIVFPWRNKIKYILEVSPLYKASNLEVKACWAVKLYNVVN